MLAGIDSNQFLWKPKPEKWCLLEVFCHLSDKESDDFITRNKQVFDNLPKTLKPIDPQGWVSERKYVEESYTHVLNQFLYKRQESVN